MSCAMCLLNLPIFLSERQPVVLDAMPHVHGKAGARAGPQRSDWATQTNESSPIIEVPLGGGQKGEELV